MKGILLPRNYFKFPLVLKGYSSKIADTSRNGKYPVENFIPDTSVFLGTLGRRPGKKNIVMGVYLSGRSPEKKNAAQQGLSQSHLTANLSRKSLIFF